MLLRSKGIIERCQITGLKKTNTLKSKTVVVSKNVNKNFRGMLMSKRFYTTDVNSHPTDEDKHIAENADKPLQEPNVVDLTEGLPVTPAVQKVVDEITKLSFLEIAALNQALAKKLGLPDSFYHQMMSGGFGGGSPGPAQQTSAPPPQEAEQPAEPAQKAGPKKVDVKLVKFPDANKFKVLKEIRLLKPGLNLMDSKALIEGLPKVVLEGASPSDAEKWKSQLEPHGVEVEFV